MFANAKSFFKMPYFVLFSCLFFVGWGTYEVYCWEKRWLENEFKRAADNYKSIVESRFQNISVELNSLKKVLQTNPDMSEADFGYFVNESKKTASEITFAIWAKSSLEMEEKIKGACGAEILYVSPEKAHSDYLHKIFANDEIHSQLKLARDEGYQLPLSAGILKVSEEQPAHKFASIIQPVYSTNTELNSIDERRKHLSGFTLVQFDTHEAIKNAVSSFTPQGIDLYLVDIEAETGNKVLAYHQSRTSKSGAPLSFNELVPRKEMVFKSSLDVQGRQWRLYAIPRDFFYQDHKTYQATVVGMLGFIISFGLFFITNASRNREVHVQNLVKIRTQELATSESKVSALFKNIGDAIVVINQNGLIENINPTIEKMFGYSKEELIGQNVNILMPVQEREQHDKYVKDSNLHETRIINKARPLKAQRKDGTTFSIELNVTKMEEAGDTLFIGVMHDISERKKQEDKLNNALEYNRTLIENVPMGCALCAMDGSLVDVNQHYCDIIGYDKEEAMKLTYWDVTPRSYEEQEGVQLKSLEATGRYGPYEKEGAVLDN